MSGVVERGRCHSRAGTESAFLLVAVFACGGCGADGGTPGFLEVDNAWSRPVAVASRAEIHETRMEGDVDRDD